ncbi:MAG: hypothetical protein QHH01_00810, partial [Spirochaetales bacterium]|nr:hypothetical protein [Spirochaetales bacterium]
MMSKLATPSLSTRPGRAGALIIILGLVFAACSPDDITSFRWTDGERHNLAFIQHARFPKGEEGVFSKERSSNEYILRTPLTIPEGHEPTVSLSILSDHVEVDISCSLGRTVLQQTSFSFASAGQVVIHLPISRTAFDRIGITVQSTASIEPRQTVLKIDGIGIAPEMRGFTAADSRLEISPGFRKVEGTQGTRWILHDFNITSEPLNTGLFLQIEGSQGIMRIKGEQSVLRLVREQGTSRHWIPSWAFAKEQTMLEIEIPSGMKITALRFEALKGTTTDLALDAGLARFLPPLVQEDHAWFRWDVKPEVMIMVFRDYAVQDRYLKRLAFFVEKYGFVGRLARDDEIRDLHGWNAHDYRAEDLARFFSEAEQQGFDLNPQEIELRSLLMTNGIIRKHAQGYSAGIGAMVSITQESESSLQYKFLVHELSHALFFTDRNYRDLAITRWQSMSEAERWFLKRYFGWMRYDVTNEFLMANEMQAY